MDADKHLIPSQLKQQINIMSTEHDPKKYTNKKLI